MFPDWPHGGALDLMKAKFPDAPTPWIDLSTGINPWPYRGPQLGDNAFDHLPTQSAQTACKQAMAQAIGASADHICLSPGSELLIRLLPVWLDVRRVAILSPTYGDHVEAWNGQGCDVIETTDPLAYADQVDAVVVCNPNNPDGRTFTREELRRARKSLEARGGWLIVDEAYCDLTPELSLAGDGGLASLIILRSFGKFFGLAGLRLGAMIVPKPLRARVSQHLGVWPVSSAALRIGASAYRDTEWQDQTRARLGRARELLRRVLQSNGLDVTGETDLFCLAYSDRATETWEHLARSGIYVRRFDAMPHHLRFGLPADEDEFTRLDEMFSLLK